MNWEIVASVASAFAVLIATVTIFLSYLLNKSNQKLTVEINNQQLLLSQRQLLIPLWDHLDKLSLINPAEPVWEDVRASANILELVAIAWEGQLIDEDIIRRIFSRTFLETYDNISQCTNPPNNFPFDGKTILRNSPATINLHKILEQEDIERAQLSPIREVSK